MYKVVRGCGPSCRDSHGPCRITLSKGRTTLDGDETFRVGGSTVSVSGPLSVWVSLAANQLELVWTVSAWRWFRPAQGAPLGPGGPREWK
jgi:hypothetical protein